MTPRARFALAALIVAALAAALAFRPGAAPDIRAASFESFVAGESLLRGSFQAGERVETPPNGEVRVRVGDCDLSIGPSSLAEFETLSPLSVVLQSGTLSARTGSAELHLRFREHELLLRPGSELAIEGEPPFVAVQAGSATVDGAVISGRHEL